MCNLLKTILIPLDVREVDVVRGNPFAEVWNIVWVGHVYRRVSTIGGSFMKSRFGRSTILLLLFLLARPAVRTSAQVVVPPLDKITSQAELGKAISALDTQLFDAYNHCDLAKFASLLDENVEFYHDQGGVTLGREKLTESVKNNICTGDTQRVLVPISATSTLNLNERSDPSGKDRCRQASYQSHPRTLGRAHWVAAVLQIWRRSSSPTLQD
jgi:hypothetical protein